MTPIMPKEIMESFLASSSMLSCSGVRFSSTWSHCIKPWSKEQSTIHTDLLHHREYHPKLGLRAGSDDNTSTSACYEPHLWLVLIYQKNGYSPLRTKVPMYAMHDRSASATGSPGAAGCTPPTPLVKPLPYPFACPFPEFTGVQVSVPFLRVVVSPVRLLSSTSRSTADTSRTSAGIRSPVVKVTISPGTSSFASICRGLPSLYGV